MNGIESIAAVFQTAAEQNRAAFMPYMMGGYPDLETSRQVIRAYCDGGADLIELGFPFSDPLADGPVIHAAATTALDAGVRFDDVLTLAAEVEGQIPVVAMVYVNQILVRGIERFVELMFEHNFSGVIVPDLPLEEGKELAALCADKGLALIPLVAPTTTDERLKQVAKQAAGFVYTVSVVGTTGERSALADDVPSLVKRVGAAIELPVALGFGISTPQNVTDAVSAGADGVIIGTRLVRVVGEEGPQAVPAALAEFVAALSKTLSD